MKLIDLSPVMARRRAGGLSYTVAQFRADPALAGLRWPDDVLEQFLFDHGGRDEFIDDYGGIDLHDVTWRLETIPADTGCIESYAEDPVYWVTIRPPEVGRHW